MRMRAHLITSSKSRSRGLGSTGQVVKRKNCTRSRGQGSFSAVKNAVVNGPTVSIGVTAP